MALHDWTYVARESYLYCSFLLLLAGPIMQYWTFSRPTIIVDFPYYHKQQHLGEKALVRGRGF